MDVSVVEGEGLDVSRSQLTWRGWRWDGQWVTLTWRAIHPTRSSNRQDRASHLLVNLDHVNNHFANISYDPNFDPYEVLVHRQTAQWCGEGIHLLNAYEVEPMLRQVKKTSPGKDKIPFWVFSQCIMFCRASRHCSSYLQYLFVWWCCTRSVAHRSHNSCSQDF